MNKRRIGNTVSDAPEIDALPVGTILISKYGDAYTHHAPGRWKQGVSGIERWAMALSGLAPLSIVYIPGEGTVRPESEVVEEVFSVLRKYLPSEYNMVVYGDQIVKLLDETENMLR